MQHYSLTTSKLRVGVGCSTLLAAVQHLKLIFLGLWVVNQRLQSCIEKKQQGLFCEESCVETQSMCKKNVWRKQSKKDISVCVSGAKEQIVS